MKYWRNWWHKWSNAILDDIWPPPEPLYVPTHLPRCNNNVNQLPPICSVIHGHFPIKTKRFWSCFNVQWGSEIRTSLDFEWSKRGWVANGPGFEWDLKSGSPTIWNRDKWPPFCQKSIEIWTKTAGFQWSCYSPTLWKPDHLKFDLQKVWILNVSRFQMAKFQIPTVLSLKKWK